MTFDIISYMEDVARRLKSIGHDPENKKSHFFKCSGITALEELMEKLTHAEYPALCVVDNPEGRLIDQTSSNLLDNQYYYFFVIDKAKINDANDRKATIDRCKVIYKKILSKMFRDQLAEQRERLQGGTGLRNLNRGDISYKAIGPLGDSCYGMWASFTLLNTTGIVYNEDDWTAI